MAINEKEAVRIIADALRDCGALDIVSTASSSLNHHTLRYDRKNGTLKLDTGCQLPIKYGNGEWFICEALFSKDGKPKKDTERGTFFRAYAKDFGDLFDESAIGGLSDKSKSKIRSGARKIGSYAFYRLGTDSIIKITEERPKRSGKRGIFEVCFRDSLDLS